ncbi:hypothetical protein EYR41_006108 [Orbilia oligospora]|uniref:Uncharacterized protein n=1 Tax=Orbilia oligospora TaxID=2813651 RepID=A0A8H2E3S4_ORBOL|nr:hypothetical protein EYR41_006108 [Orbilia oligospora]
MSKKTEDEYITLLNPSQDYLVQNVFHQELTEERKIRLAEAKRYHADYLSKYTKKEFWDVFGVGNGQDWSALRDIVRAVHLAYINEHEREPFNARIPNEDLARMLDAIATQKVFRELSRNPQPLEAYSYWLLRNHIEGQRRTKPSRSLGDVVTSQPAFGNIPP